MADVPPATPQDRRRSERRINARVSELTVPEFRKIVITSLLFLIVLALFLWMVRTVIIAAVLGVIIAAYIRPLHTWLAGMTRSVSLAALLTLTLVIVPVVAIVIYSYLELRAVVEYVATHQSEIVERIDRALRGYPFVPEEGLTERIREWVLAASNYGAAVPEILQEAMAQFAISTTVFLFTAFYILTDTEKIAGYVRSKVPPRYSELSATLERNVRGVLYGAVFATLVTQLLKSGVILGLNLTFDVPLAVVLTILSFIVGFFPIVGSWSVYVPVAAWLLIFRNEPVGAAVVLLTGFFVNTILISTLLRPKLAAEKSRILNFYWMFVGLVTGVYTFGIEGILLGPILIGILKAVFDTITTSASWRLLDEDGELTSPGTSGAPA